MGRSEPLQPQEGLCSGLHANTPSAADKHPFPPAALFLLGAGKSSLGGSEQDAESLAGSVERGSRASGGGRRGQRDPDFEEEALEVDPFDAAVEQLYEKR